MIEVRRLTRRLTRGAGRRRLHGVFNRRHSAGAMTLFALIYSIHRRLQQRESLLQRILASFHVLDAQMFKWGQIKSTLPSSRVCLIRPILTRIQRVHFVRFLA